MKAIEIHTPITEEVIRKLKSGNLLAISGTIYTARDRAHKIIADLYTQQKPIPVDFTNEIIFYAGPSPAPEGMPVGAIGPTTSYRMDAYTDVMLSLGVRMFIGKGSRSEEVKRLLIQHKAVYCSGFGGAAAYLAQCVVDAHIVAFEELGPEAIYKLTVEKFPVIVINDIYGGDLYADIYQSSSV
ncbi:MAG: FumA C-terminus/TtdB family hydratase beta subunit [Spirochaetes bacterium]|nr:FumA C-terminus/TtdB family hydratase beta subunit [Spirochaetota bacterium]